MISTVVLLSSVNVQAKTWYLPNGILVSDTCIDAQGNWFTFFQNYGPVNAPCSWQAHGHQFFGHFH